MSRVIRKPAFCICENEAADQLCGKKKPARLISAYTYTKIPLLPKFRNFKSLAIFCCCTARFLSDLVGNTEDCFSRVAAQLSVHRANDLTSLYANNKDADPRSLIAPLFFCF